MQVSISRNDCMMGIIVCSRLFCWSSLRSSLHPTTTMTGTFNCAITETLDSKDQHGQPRVKSSVYQKQQQHEGRGRAKNSSSMRGGEGPRAP